MLVDLERIPAEGQSVSCTVEDSAQFGGKREFDLEAPSVLSGKLERREGDAFEFRGTVTADIGVACVKCLERVKLPIREDVALTYLPQSDNQARDGEEERGLEADELSVSFYRDGQIELMDVLWEQLVLALPMNPICGSRCQGLCPQCGVNRNTESCGCSSEEHDPRWDALKTLVEPARE